MDGPVVEEVGSAWRRRRTQLWTAATGAVGTVAAALGAAAWQAPLAVTPQNGAATLAAAGAGALVYRGWRRWKRGAANQTIAHETVVTPGGQQPGTVLRRPVPFSKKDRLSVRILALVCGVPLAASWAAVGSWQLAVPIGAAAGWGAIRLTHQLMRLATGVALTPDGVVTTNEMIAWDKIDHATVVKTWGGWQNVCLTVGDREVVLPGSNYAMPAFELAELIRGYQAHPSHRAALGQPGR